MTMSNGVIDLCSDTEEDKAMSNSVLHVKLSKFRHGLGLGADGIIIDLLSDSDELNDQGQSTSAQQSNDSSTRLGNESRDLSEPNATLSTTDLSTGINIGDENSFSRVTDSKVSEGDQNSDDECRIVGQIGYNALSDFPHSREDCVVHPFADDETMAGDHCSNCFCFVCDVRVSDCQHWTLHCCARFQDPFWKAERDRKRRMADQYDPQDYPAIPVKRAKALSHQAPKLCRVTMKQRTPQTPRTTRKTPKARSVSRMRPYPDTLPLMPTVTPPIPIIPKESPWLNASIKLVGVIMTAEECQLYNAAKKARPTSKDSTLLQCGAPAYLVEKHVTEPLSLYEWTKDWCCDQRRNSSKVQALVEDLTLTRTHEEATKAIIFCQDPKWQLAIAMALNDAKFKVLHGTVAHDSSRTDSDLEQEQTNTSGEVWIQPTKADRDFVLQGRFSRAYLMEQHVNMAWEAAALGRIERHAGQVLHIRKLILLDTAEANVVDFQNALIDRYVTMRDKTFEIDREGVAILLKGLW